MEISDDIESFVLFFLGGAGAAFDTLDVPTGLAERI